MAPWLGELFCLIDEVELAVFFLVEVAEFGLFVGAVDFAALDVGGLDECCCFEDVAVGDDEGGVFAGFYGADEVVNAEDLGGGEGDGFEGGLLGEAMGDGEGGGVGEVSFVSES